MEFKNKDLVPVSNFLASLKLPAKVARGVAKFQKSLQEILKDLNESEKDLFKQYGADVQEGGHVSWPAGTEAKQADFKKAHDDLFIETVDIQPRYKEEFSVIKEYFKDFDQEIEAQNVLGFDTFMDAFEPIEETKGDK